MHELLGFVVMLILDCDTNSMTFVVIHNLSCYRLEVILLLRNISKVIHAD